jgi:phosphoribosyl-ATP pyrophosphohydrolase
MSGQIEALYRAVAAKRGDDPASCRTARLFAQGRKKIGKKLGEEAVEVVVEFLKHNRGGVVRESADLLYHLAVLWAELGVAPQEIWAEMDRRTAMLGLAEKLPKVVRLPVPGVANLR